MSSSNSSIKSSIHPIPFDGNPEKYSVWVFRIRTAFKAKGWSHFIPTTEKEKEREKEKGQPSNDKEVDDKSNIHSNLQHDTAFASLVESLPEDLLPLFVEKEDCVSLWTAIVEHFESDTETSKDHLRNQLSNVKMASERDYIPFWMELQSILRKLRSMGEIISESEIRHHILKGLHTRFMPLRTHFRLAPASSIEKMHQQLKDFQEEILIEIKNNGSGSSSTIDGENYYHGQVNSNRHRSNNKPIHRNNSHSNNGGNKSSGECWTCHKTDHKAFDCPENKHKKKCGYCRNIGTHVESECHRKKANMRNQGNSTSESSAPNRSSNAPPSLSKNFSSNSRSAPSSKQHSAHFQQQEESDHSEEDSFLFAAMEKLDESPNPDPIDLTAYKNTTIASECGSNVSKAIDPTTIEMVLDSGSSVNICNSKVYFTQGLHSVKPVRVRVANNGIVVLDKGGPLRVAIDEARSKWITIENVYFAPLCPVNLLSIGVITKSGKRVSFDNGMALIEKKGKENNSDPIVIMEVPMKGNLYVKKLYLEKPVPLMFSGAVPVDDAVPSGNGAFDFYRLTHERLGHPGRSKIEQLVKSSTVTGLEKLAEFNFGLKDGSLCHGCEMGKTTRASFSKLNSNEPAREIMDRWHADIKGPINTPTIGGNRYLLTITDEKSRRTFGELLPHKSDASDRIMNLCRRTQTETGKTLKEFHSDNGTEFVNSRLKEFFREQGTHFTTTTPGTPQHNGIAERVNRTIFNSARAMMFHSQAPVHFWGHAVQTAIVLKNKMLTRVNGDLTPETVWNQQSYQLDHLNRLDPSTAEVKLFKTSLKNIRVFGCNVYIHQQGQSSLEARSREGIFLGYSDERKRYYRVYEILTGKILIRRDVHFDEGSFTFMRQHTGNQRYRPFDANVEEEFNPMVKQVQSQPKLQLTELEESLPSITDSVSQSSADNSQIESKVESNSISDSDSDDGVDDSNIESPMEISSSSPSTSVAAPVSIPSNPSLPPNRMVRFVADGVTVHSSPFVKGKKPKAIFDAVRSSNILPVARRSQKLSHTHQSVFTVTDEKNSSNSTLPDTESVVIPKSYREAMSSVYSDQWKSATLAEYDSLLLNRVFDLVELPRHANLIGCRWVFAKKLNSNGEVKRFKARLVAKGYKQIAEVDYYDTFAAVMRYKSLKLILSIGSMLDMEIRHLDVPTAFLNAELKEDVYVEQPEGFHNGDKKMVWKLNKSLYGIKQAPNNWNHDLNNFLISLGFTRCRSDTCIYVKQSMTGRMMLIGVFVDDLIPIYSSYDVKEWNDIHSSLKSKYNINDTGEVELVLGMRVTRDRMNKTMKLDQEKYIEKILQQYELHQCNPADTPTSSYKLSQADSPSNVVGGKDKNDSNNSNEVSDRLLKQRYQSMVGSLNYAAISTRPDITYAVNVLSRYLHNPGQQHMIACKRVFRYLKGTTNLGIILGGDMNHDQRSIGGDSKINSFELLSYSDSDWGGDVDTRRSTSGYLIFFNGSLISWQSKRQRVVALSSCEAEYYAISSALTDIRWCRQLVKELIQFDLTLKSYVISSSGMVDNQSAIAISSHDVHHTRTKHIDIRHHFIRDEIQNGSFKLNYIASQDQLGDLLTKGVGKIIFQRLRQQFMQ